MRDKPARGVGATEKKPITRQEHLNETLGRNYELGMISRWRVYEKKKKPPNRYNPYAQ